MGLIIPASSISAAAMFAGSRTWIKPSHIWLLDSGHVTLNGSNASACAPLEGHDLLLGDLEQATEANQPPWSEGEPGVLNGKPYITGVAWARNLVSSAAASAWVNSVNGPFSLTLIARRYTASTNVDRILYTGVPDAGRGTMLRYSGTSGNVQCLVCPAGGTRPIDIVVTGALGLNADVCLTFQFSSAGAEVWKNGALIASQSPQAAFPTGNPNVALTLGHVTASALRSLYVGAVITALEFWTPAKVRHEHRKSAAEFGTPYAA